MDLSLTSASVHIFVEDVGIVHFRICWSCVTIGYNLGDMAKECYGVVLQSVIFFFLEDSYYINGVFR